MQRLRVAQIEPGQVFDQPLFLPWGQELLGAGVELSLAHLQAIHRCGGDEVLLANDTRELLAAGLLRQVDTSQLRLGQRAGAGLITASGSLLIEPGEAIEEHHLDALAAAGEVFAANQPVARERRERIMVADALLESIENKRGFLQLRVKPDEARPWLTPSPAGEWPDAATLADQRAAQVETLRNLIARVEAGVTVPVRLFNDLVDDLLERLAHHPSRFAQLALLCPRREDYLPDHTYTVCVLAMAAGAQLRWSREYVRELGLAALLFDLGMLLVPERIRTGAREFTDIDRARVHRHPVFSLSMLQVISDLPEIVQLAAVQHHERENGTGYPRGKRKATICDYARVLAVADTFAAGTEPRHYRRRKLPYTVMEETLRSAASGVLWPRGVRALVQAAGLFPVGSYVKLSTGANAHVIESNAKDVDRPVVQPLDAEGQPLNDPVDLATLDRTTLSVVRPIAGPMG